jgi:hypothetical protein
VCRPARDKAGHSSPRPSEDPDFIAVGRQFWPSLVPEMCYHGRSTFPLICARPLMWFGLSFSRWRTQHTKIKGWVEPFYSVRESEDQRRERTGARIGQHRPFGEFFGGDYGFRAQAGM